MAERMVHAEKSKENKQPVSAIDDGSKSSSSSKQQQQPTLPPKVPTKSSGKGKSSVAPSQPASGSINHEVLKILQELSSNVTKQGQDLQTLSGRVDGLFEMPDDDYYEYYEESEEQKGSDHNSQETNAAVGGSVSTEVDIVGDTPAPKRPRTVFQGLQERYQTSEKVDNEINEDLSIFVNTSFRQGLSEDRASEIMKDIMRPSNCEGIAKTRVNPGLWRLLKPQTQTDDAKMQAIQACVVKASVNVVKLLDKEGQDLDSQSFEWGTNALALLGHSNKLLNNKRKETHKYDFDPKFFPLTSPNLPYTEFLYGSEADINRNVKDITEMCRIGKVKPARGRGGARGSSGPYRRGGRPMRRGYRGRGGYQKPFDQPAGSKNQQRK